MRHLVIGYGEIGKALSQVIGCDACDVEGTEGRYDAIHICYPYSPGFADSVRAYQRKHHAKHVVIHSTVPVGTSASLGAIHSPVTGVHPHLAASLTTFRKPLGGPGAQEMADEFGRKGIPTEVWSSSGATEAGKLYALLIYGVNVLLEKEIHAFCAERGLEYGDVYKKMVGLYNDGYQDMEMPWFRMYELVHRDGPLGGHCVAQNAPMLGTFFADVLKVANDALDQPKSDNVTVCSLTPTPPART